MLAQRPMITSGTIFFRKLHCLHAVTEFTSFLVTVQETPKDNFRYFSWKGPTFRYMKSVVIFAVFVVWCGPCCHYTDCFKLWSFYLYLLFYYSLLMTTMLRVL